MAQGLFGQLALVGDMQVVELAAGMGHATDFGYALLEAGLVAGEVVADQLAFPVAQEGAGMLAGTAGAEIVDHRTQISERAGNIGPNIGALSLFHPRSQHLHRGFVGMDDALFQHDVPQRIDQRLQLHAAAADPLRQGRARDGQASAGEDFFLAVQRQMVGVFGHHDLGQQAGGRDALVDHLSRNRRLDQRFALRTDPFDADMSLHREDARGVVELFADILADALELAAAGTLRGVRLVMDQGARKLRWQGGALGLLAWLGCYRCGTQRLELGLDGRDVCIEQVVQQTDLVRAELLAAPGKLMPLEEGNLVSQLLVARLVILDLLIEAGDLLVEACDTLCQLRRQCAQLLGSQVVESRRGHGRDCAGVDDARR